MNYRDEATLLARTLAELITTRASERVSHDTLAAALNGRAETLALIRQVLIDTTGLNTPARPIQPKIADLEAHPVNALVQAVDSHPTPVPHRSPIHVLAAGEASAWTDVARHALFASQHWATSRPPAGEDQRWSAVADAAAFARALTVLDQHLLTGAQTLHDTDPVNKVDEAVLRQLRTAQTSGLRSAATQAQMFAAAGALPSWDPAPRNPHTKTRVMLVRSALHVPAAQERLAGHIATATHLQPDTVRLTMLGQARLLTAAGQVLGQSEPATAAHATALARRLATAAQRGGRVAALMNIDDPRPIAQTRELLQHLRNAHLEHRANAAKYSQALTDLVDRSPAVITALATHAERATRTGDWLVAGNETHTSTRPLWQPLRTGDPEPPLVVALSAIAARAATPNTPTHPATDPSQRPEPRHILQNITPAELLRRPFSPGQPRSTLDSR